MARPLGPTFAGAAIVLVAVGIGVVLWFANDSGSDRALACSKRETVEADLDGDGAEDLVYHDWIRDRAMLGACTATGRSDQITGAGQSELLQIIDIQSDGQDEILYGGTTASAQIASIAILSREAELETVGLISGKSLLVVLGLDPGAPPNRQPTGAAFGCEDVNGDGRLDLVQVSVWPRGKEFRWTRTAYRIEDASASRIAKKWGNHENERSQPDVGEVMEVAGSLTKPCESEGTD
jgi:hypothetical protein